MNANKVEERGVGDEPRNWRLTGVAALLMLAAAQLLSAVGTRMTNFSLAVFVFSDTGSTTALTTLSMCAFLSTVVFSPLAGVLVDRWPRRATIMISDSGSAVVTMLLVLLFISGDVQLWHLFVANVLTGTLLAFQLPAYMSTISVIVDKKSYPRAAAIFSMTRSAPAVLAPMFAAVVLELIDIKAVLTIDSFSYVLAVASVFLVRFPPKEPAKADKSVKGLVRDMGFGFRYIWSRPALRGLETVQFIAIMLSGFGAVLITPFILSRSGGDVGQVGIVSSIGAAGGVAGGLLMASLKPTRRKVVRMLLAILLMGVVGRIVFAFGHGIPVWAIGMVGVWFSLPFMNGYGHSVWQEKVDPKLHGRVFATRQFLEGMGIPLAFMITGPLTDYVFEPMMRPGQPLAQVFGGMLGTDPGSGMALIYVLTGTLTALVAIAGLAARNVREIEVIVPDFEPAPAPARA